MGKNIVFVQKVLGHLDFHMHNNKVGLLPIVRHKSNSEWINDLNARAKTTEPSEEVGEFHDIGFGNDFLDKAPQHEKQEGT